MSEERPVMGHKEDCLWGDDPEHRHRVPIDCETYEGLMFSIRHLGTLVEQRDAQLMRLKAEIYDLRWGEGP